MNSYVNIENDSPRSSKNLEKENLLGTEAHLEAGRKSASFSRFLVPGLAISNILLLLVILILSLKVFRLEILDDNSSLVYCESRPCIVQFSDCCGLVTLVYQLRSAPPVPANTAVEYVEKQFDGTFYSKGNEYTGFPTDETDALWEDLFDFGISVIGPEEAAKLAIPTLPIPGTERYLIELDVFHQLHCLNRIRKVFYPERYGNFLHAMMDADGNVNRSKNEFRHWGEHTLSQAHPLNSSIMEEPHTDNFALSRTRSLHRHYTPILAMSRRYLSVALPYRLAPTWRKRGDRYIPQASHPPHMPQLREDQGVGDRAPSPEV
ncbi:hypothetical protein H2200_013394 [Cladophialophora chaetospira]|uniref:Uncharacterized protein n=1 Tax=Cladophialophora chaetospira TaxID=386627 RepID=A0AA38WVQ4_9EURO|nr:hypothetical protein H2200_013394 [Cladophialophora chaetospira]